MILQFQLLPQQTLKAVKIKENIFSQIYLWKYLPEVGPQRNCILRYFDKYNYVYQPPCTPVALLLVQSTTAFVLQNSLFSVYLAISDFLLLT